MNRFLTKVSLMTGLVLVFLTIGYSQNLTSAETQDKAYINVLKGRADKIVRTLDIDDAGKVTTVRDLIVMQYYKLSKIHDARDAKIEALKEQETKGVAVDKKVEMIKKKADKEIKKLHKEYIAKLSRQISADQVDKVKDGMTYHVVPLTYKGYLELLPDLTEEQKKKVKEYLLEAREMAMDAGSSEEKHHCFGQYKGKINNYLSANGYDLKEAEKNLKRKKQG